MEARTNKCPKFSRVNINKIINKKIANLADGVKPRTKTKNREVKNVGRTNATEEVTNFIDEADATFSSNSSNEPDVFVESNETEDTIRSVDQADATCSSNSLIYEDSSRNSNSLNDWEVVNQAEFLNSANDITFSYNNLEDDSLAVDALEFQGELHDLSGMTYNYFNAIEN